MACGISPDQESNPCPLHWQADFNPLCHQGSSRMFLTASSSRKPRNRIHGFTFWISSTNKTDAFYILFSLFFLFSNGLHLLTHSFCFLSHQHNINPTSWNLWWVLSDLGLIKLNLSSRFSISRSSKITLTSPIHPFASVRYVSACMLSHFSHVWLFVTLWTAACQAPLSMGFSRQEYWSGLPCPPPGYLPNPGIEPTSLMSPALAGRFFTTSTTWEALCWMYYPQIYRLLHLGSQLFQSSELWLQDNRKCHWVEAGIDPFGSNVDRGSSMAFLWYDMSSTLLIYP